MLIDAGHPEETRVVVSDGHELQEFDVESSVKTQIKANIYLAKVVRIEPSLQSAFVEYGGNRHGFLPFSEIHTDYFQVPVSDRDEITAEQARLVEEASLDDINEDEAGDTADGEAVPAESASSPARGGRRRQQDDREDHPEAILHAAILQRGYRIQEVIRKNQILLVQVTKEERGTKGAALSTYLSIAGRYCVLMPNTPRGGGISRKITDQAQRRRLKEVAAGLDIPEGMGLIIRTAGQNRSRPEIRRDYNSLLKQWEDLRAKAYMRFLMPSHASRVKLHREPVSLFHAFDVEREIDAMHSPVVPLASGGSLVINPTEALVVIDVNSGRSTRERAIEETALKTNLEATREIARQMRLRDLAGLVVIDFIDMDDRRNDATVERRMKEAVKSDRARTQVGRISHFGLMELSRQRLRPSLEEAISAPCPTCNGSGYMRSTESTALHVLRGIESAAATGTGGPLLVTAPTAIAFQLLNHKRLMLTGIETRYNVTVTIEADDRLLAPDFHIDTGETGAAAPAPRDDATQTPDEPSPPRRRKRSRRRRRDSGSEAADPDPVKADGQEGEEEAAEQGERKRRRRGRRGGRRRKTNGESAQQTAGEDRPEQRGDTGPAPAGDTTPAPSVPS